jgi:Leucine-rich repeat (LRR) protein
MKTRLVLLIFALSSLVTYGQQYTSIPDPNFEQALIDLGIDSEGQPTDGQVLTADIDWRTSLNVSSKGITDLTGIQAFTALEILNCSSNNFLPTLNVFNNTALTEIRAFNCALTSITLPNNNILTYLSIGNNHFSGLDVSAYPSLEFLSCGNNFNVSIGILDLTSNPNLTTLYCQNAGITSLDISQCTNLELLVCYDNSLSSLDLTANTALSEIRCYNNSINTLTFTNSNYNSLLYLDCSYNPIGSLDVSIFPNLETLYCAGNNLSSLDVSNLTSLIDFGLWENNLSSLNLSSNTSLEYVEPGSNTNLSNLTLPNNKATLTQLWAYDMNLSSLNYAEYTQLQYLDIGINNFTSADVSILPNLLEFYCNENQLTSLNIANGFNDNLAWMWAHDNPPGLCIQVDDLSEATAKSSPNWQRDPGSSFSLNCSLGLDEFSENNVSIFPNPTKSFLTIDLNRNATYTLTNLFGQEIRNGNLLSGSNELDINSLSNGLYFLNIKTLEGKIAKKIIKE